MMNPTRLLACLLCGCASAFSAVSAQANVIYDVLATYQSTSSSSAPIYRYAFAMEFANNSGAKTAADLVGGDFFAESMSRDNHPAVFVSDQPIPSLTPPPGAPTFAFDPATLALTFFAQDLFQWGPPGVFTSPFESVSQSSNLTRLRFYDGQGGGQGNLLLETTVPLISAVVTQRPDATPVPLPATLLLTGLGLAGIVLNRRRARLD